MVNKSNNPTKKVFVIGWPIEQSKSPIIHGHWLKLHGLEGSYEKIAVHPDDLASFISSLKNQGFVGGNVTIPHKQAVLAHVDVIHPTAERLGAANTLWFEEGQLHADNTDGYGFLANLDQQAPGWDQLDRGKALILGAGGATRPIINGLFERGFDKLVITNRTMARAQELASLFANLGFGSRVSVLDWDNRSAELEDIDLVVNCSSLGMIGQPPLEMSLEGLQSSALVTDIVYNPLETGILRQARKAGNRVVDGLGMLLHQAVPGFEHWFGVRPTVTDQLREQVLETK
ncbi:shikimate dehydrogenase [uncultured Cohaesibacter sp.]|uniref:shikimate dehydrogenase n=1 Tax=uncultured Cohaesibacter sp. TaxID=1002546 RepID=UPI00292DB564|nr:shikimate dehydrogenase [uncultured Cohaesibacter sp.]